jgi:hypothetical protein
MLDSPHNRKRAWRENYLKTELKARSRDSVVDIATGYGLNDRGIGVQVPVGSRIFSSPRRPHRLWDPPNLLSKGRRVLFFLRVERPERKAEHFPPISAEVKKLWIYTLTPAYSFTV